MRLVGKSPEMKVFCVAIIIGMAFSRDYIHCTCTTLSPSRFSFSGSWHRRERVKVTLLPFPLGKCPHLDVFIRYWNSSVCNSDQLSIQRQSLEFKTDFPTYRQFFFVDFQRCNKSAKKLVVAFSSALLLLLQLVPMHLQTALNGFLTQFLLVFNDLEENTYA